MRVAVLGTGIMGAPMARNIAAVAAQMGRATEEGHGEKDTAATIHASRPAG